MVVTARAVASGILRRAARACVDAVVVVVVIVVVGARDDAVMGMARENSSAMRAWARGRARYGWS